MPQARGRQTSINILKHIKKIVFKGRPSNRLQSNTVKQQNPVSTASFLPCPCQGWISSAPKRDLAFPTALSSSGKKRYWSSQCCELH